jgi:hypothetical protein
LRLEGRAQFAWTDRRGSGHIRVMRARLSFVAAFGVVLASPAARAGFVPKTDAGAPSGPADNVVLADVDGDGRVDFVSSAEQIHLGQGDGTFVPGPTCAPGGPPVVADFDNDGRRDVFRVGDAPVICYGGPDGELTAEPGSVEPNPSAGLDTEGPAASGAAALDVDGDGWLDLYMTNYEGPGMVWFRDVLYVNDGAGRLQVAAEIPDPAYPGRGVTSGDFDEDGDPDLYVSNYRLVWNYLWRNNGAGGIVDEAEALGATGGNAHTISSAFGDLDGDGHLDILVGNFAHPGQPEIKVLLNEVVDGGAFVDTGNGGIAWQESHAGVALGDWDADGDLDVFVTTVYPGDHGRLHRNEGDATFVDATEEEGLTGQDQGYSVAWADVDGDGHLDVWLGGQQQNHLFLAQDRTGHWLQIDLRGDGQIVNAAAIGARVTVQAGARTIVREVQAEGGERGASDLRVHLGLGVHADPVEVEVRWPWAETCSYPATPDAVVEIVYEPGCDGGGGDETGEDGEETGSETDTGTDGGGGSAGTVDETGGEADAGASDDAGAGCGCRDGDPPAGLWTWALVPGLSRRRR